MNFYERNKYWFLVGALVLIIILLIIKIVTNTDTQELTSLVSNNIETNDTNQNNGSIFIDVKGAVKKPGVYEISSNSKVIDAINLAGGLSKNAVTKNINLSAHLQDEMVVYVFTKNELKSNKTTTSVPFTTNVINYDKCITTTSEVINNKEDVTQSTLVNINTASKEELMTLTGVGASKADAIIVYRMENKFTKIEDIMNVSGIGESAFAKIKDNITV